MKILHVVSSMNPIQGGVCQAVRDIIFGLSLLPSQPEVVNEVVSLDSPDDSFVTESPFKIHALGHGKTPWNYNKELYLWLNENVKNYSKVIVHGLWQYHSAAIYKCYKKQAFEYFIMPHGMLDPYFQKAKERRLKAMRNVLFWKLVEKKFINHASGILFTCEEEMLLAREPFSGYKPKKELVVGLGVENPPAQQEAMTDAFAKHVPGWNGKPFIFFISRIHQKKGVDLLVEAYIKLQDEIKDLPQLVVAGPGLDTAYGKKIVSAAGQNFNILFPGMISGNTKWGAFYNCSVFILPSHQENFGIVVAEALACSKPVLISNKVNIWREIEKGSAGIVNEDTLEGTLAMLRQWHKMDDTAKKQIGEDARMLFENNYTIKQAASVFYNNIK